MWSSFEHFTKEWYAPNLITIASVILGKKKFKKLSVYFLFFAFSLILYFNNYLNMFRAKIAWNCPNGSGEEVEKSKQMDIS